MRWANSASSAMCGAFRWVIVISGDLVGPFAACTLGRAFVPSGNAQPD
jgi:hypothetical protein